MISKEILMNDIDLVKKFVDVVTKYSEDIDLMRGRYVIDAKSVMGIFSLDLSKPITIGIHTDDEERANAFFADLNSLGVLYE